MKLFIACLRDAVMKLFIACLRDAVMKIFTLKGAAMKIFSLFGRCSAEDIQSVRKMLC